MPGPLRPGARAMGRRRLVRGTDARRITGAERAATGSCMAPRGLSCPCTSADHRSGAAPGPAGCFGAGFRSSTRRPGAGAGGSGSALGTVTVKGRPAWSSSISRPSPPPTPQFGESDTTRSTGTGTRRGPQWRRPALKAPFSRGAFAGPPCRLAATCTGSRWRQSPRTSTCRRAWPGDRPRGGQLLACLHDVTERRLPRRVQRPPNPKTGGVWRPRRRSATGVRRQFGATLRAARQLSHADQTRAPLDSSGSIWTIHT